MLRLGLSVILYLLALDASSPIMGWSSWESFAKKVSDENIMKNVKLLISTGLLERGYSLIQVDDGWQNLNRSSRWISRENYYDRPSNSKGLDKLPDFIDNGPPGCIIPDPIKFPRGMKHLVEEVKQAGFRFGLYTSGETYVCDAETDFLGAYSSSSFRNLRKADAKCFVDWGIDLLKIDACHPKAYSVKYYTDMLSFWKDSLPGVLLYNSRFGCMAKTTCGNIYRCPMSTNPFTNRHIEPYCTNLSGLSRTGPDMKPDWEHILTGISTRFGRGTVSRPGFWSDPDYLVPNQKITFQERRSQFSMWCVNSAPLLISVNLEETDAETIRMLKNEDAIRVNQVYEGDAGDIMSRTNNMWVFHKIFRHSKAVVAVNVGEIKDFTLFDPEQESNFIMWLETVSPIANPVSCRYHNVWTGESGVLTSTPRTFPVKQRDCVFFLITDCLAVGEDTLTHMPTTTSSPAKAIGEPTSDAPTLVPSVKATKSPTFHPSQPPTFLPTTKLTRSPTGMPSRRPTFLPTTKPTKAPTGMPSVKPTQVPTFFPTNKADDVPSSLPTQIPSHKPFYRASTDQPTILPTPEYTSAPISNTPTVDSSSNTPTVDSISESPTEGPTLQIIESTMSPFGLDPDCRPIAGTSSKMCNVKALRCNMKWVGLSCARRKATLSDGGCRCLGYCGFLCQSTCNRDKECMWKIDEGKCYNRATGIVGSMSPDVCNPNV